MIACMNLPTPTHGAGCEKRSIFKGSLTDFNSELSFSVIGCLTKAKEHSLLYWLPITGGRITLPRILVLWEMQLASSRI